MQNKDALNILYDIGLGQVKDVSALPEMFMNCFLLCSMVMYKVLYCYIFQTSFIGAAQKKKIGRAHV